MCVSVCLHVSVYMCVCALRVKRIELLIAKWVDIWFVVYSTWTRIDPEAQNTKITGLSSVLLAWVCMSRRLHMYMCSTKKQLRRKKLLHQLL